MADNCDSPQRDQVSDLIMAVLVISAVLAAFAALQDKILAITAMVALVQLMPFGFISAKIDWLVHLPLLGPWLFSPAHRFVDALSLYPFPQIATSDWIALQIVAGRAAFVLYGAPILVGLIWLRGRRAELRFRWRHSLDSLINAQSLSWPLVGIVRSFASLDERRSPVEALSSASRVAPNERMGRLLQPIEKPSIPPAMEIALRPEVWLASQRLAQSTVANNHPFRAAQKEIQVSEHLSQDAVCEVLETQLGPLWHGFGDMRPSLRALTATFALGFDERSKECEHLLASISVLAETTAQRGRLLDDAICRCKKLNSQIDSVLGSDAGTRLKVVADSHAYQRPAILSMLLAARLRKGVFASASFIWLKREDRILWYVLNSAGNNVAAAEAAGVVAHFRAEWQSSQPLVVPMVSLAAKALIVDYLDLDTEKADVKRLVREARKSVGEKLSDIVKTQSNEQRPC